MTLGERIKTVRKNSALNQSEFADMLGISQTHVSKVEHGIENPSAALLLLISLKFDVSINWLENGIGNYNTDPKHGKWEQIDSVFRCSECGYEFEHEGYIHFFNFCPVCGLRMDGDAK